MLLHHVDQLKDSAVNASVTAWHLADWVFNDLTTEQSKALNLEDLRELQGRARKECRALYLCNHVANASKHCSVEDKLVILPWRPSSSAAKLVGRATFWM